MDEEERHIGVRAHDGGRIDGVRIEAEEDPRRQDDRAGVPVGQPGLVGTGLGDDRGAALVRRVGDDTGDVRTERHSLHRGRRGGEAQRVHQRPSAALTLRRSKTETVPSSAPVT
ncbi:MAG: hypothetical protein FJ028_06985 [Chloroflexi bacterium]|nr:hypothetical protein [Chloroflexota bacterium]